MSELLRYAAQNPSHPMTPFLPLFIDRDHESGLTPAEMYFEHIFPHYTRSNTERALDGSGIAFPPVDEPTSRQQHRAPDGNGIPESPAGHPAARSADGNVRRGPPAHAD